MTEKSYQIYQVVESVILGMSVGLIAWTAHTVISQGRELSSHEAHITTNTGRLGMLEDRGSRSLETHVKADDEREIATLERVAKLESAMTIMQTIAGDLKAVAVKLEVLTEGQRRLEAKLNSKP